MTVVAFLARIVAAICCRYDVHQFGRGLRRIDVEDLRPDRTTFVVPCTWCARRFWVQAGPGFDLAAASVSADNAIQGHQPLCSCGHCYAQRAERRN